MSDANEELDKNWVVYGPPSSDEIWNDPSFGEVSVIVEYEGHGFFAGMYEGTEDADVDQDPLFLSDCFHLVGKKWVKQEKGEYGKYGRIKNCAFDDVDIARVLMPREDLSLDETMQLFDKTEKVIRETY